MKNENSNSEHFFSGKLNHNSTRVLSARLVFSVILTTNFFFQRNITCSPQNRLYKQRIKNIDVRSSRNFGSSMEEKIYNCGEGPSLRSKSWFTLGPDLASAGQMSCDRNCNEILLDSFLVLRFALCLSKNSKQIRRLCHGGGGGVGGGVGRRCRNTRVVDSSSSKDGGRSSSSRGSSVRWW